MQIAGAFQSASEVMRGSQAAQRLGLAASVACLTRDFQSLFITSYGVMDFGERVVRIAERDKVTDGGVALVQFLRGCESGLAPADAFARALAQFQHILAGVRIGVAQL